MEIEKSISHSEVVGIGFTLTKSDVRANDDYLAHKNDRGKTTFRICPDDTKFLLRN